MTEVEDLDHLSGPSPELVAAIKEKLKGDRDVNPFHLRPLFPDEREIDIESGWLQATDELVFDEIVIKNDKNYGDWCLHYFRDEDGDRVVVPIHGWTNYEVGADGLLTFVFEPDIYHDGRTSVSVKHKDFDSAMKAKELFIDHWGK